jgi:ATP phosphoribosyltransferase
LSFYFLYIISSVLSVLSVVKSDGRSVVGASVEEVRQMVSEPVGSIRLAIPSKGHLYEGIIDLLRTAGYKVRRASDRQYEATIVGHPRFHVVFMRPTDIVIQVQEGRCHLGVTGMDVYAEHAVEAGEALVVVPDLGYGGCRLAVAVPESWIDVTHVMDLVDLTTEFKAAGRTFRVSTKYPALVRQYFRRLGIYYYQLIYSDGALELHPSLGIADIIVDLTSSGTTLKDNRLRELEGGTVLDSAACLVGHGPSLAALAAEGEAGPLALLLDALDGVRGTEGLLHLEVVGSPAAPGSGTTPAAATAEAVAVHLRDQGGSHIARGEVWDDRGAPGWRVTALLPARNLTACRRALFRLGAGRVVGLRPQVLFDRDAPSTFDDLRRRLPPRPDATPAHFL